MLNLPQVGDVYNPRDFARRDVAFRAADAENYKKYQNIAIPQAQRLVLQSPDGTWWEVTVNNAGALTTASTSHP